MNETIPSSEVEGLIRLGERIAFLNATHPDVWLGSGDSFEHVSQDESGTVSDRFGDRLLVVVGKTEDARRYVGTLRQQGFPRAFALEGGDEAFRTLGIQERAGTPDKLYPTVW